jgi:hypothetical protein
MCSGFKKIIAITISTPSDSGTNRHHRVAKRIGFAPLVERKFFKSFQMDIATLISFTFIASLSSLRFW